MAENIQKKIYIAIDLKSFYASVECRERGLDPLSTNLVVADNSRTEKTICLAVTPSLKSFGISGRARLFEVIQKVKEVNDERRFFAKNHKFTGSSYDYNELVKDKNLQLDYIVAPPRMAYYLDYSARIYNIYLKYIAPEDIHVYSVDEVFIDVTSYLKMYKMTPRQLAMTLIKDVLAETGITATAGIGTNLYLCKIAMDIVAKKMPADKDGVRIAELDEMTYRKKLWEHRPITDFWRVGKGTAKRLERYGIYTMGQIAEISTKKNGEDMFYRLFGVNAELLIDHAWGWEPCTISDIKAYKPQAHSLSSGQVLQEPYNWEKARLIVCEMADLLALDMVEKGVVTDQITLTIGYDVENIINPAICQSYVGEVVTDGYGRKIPKHAHGTYNFRDFNASSRMLIQGACEIFDRTTDNKLLVRRINICANHITPENEVEKHKFEQLDMFTDYENLEKQRKGIEREKNIQRAIIQIKNKYGKNAILKGMNFEEGAMSIQRNAQIGGHKA